MQMGRLVKKAEFAVLGTLAIALFSYTHMPAYLASLDEMTSPDSAAFTASAAAPYVDDTVTAPIPGQNTGDLPETTAPAVVATSSSETTISVQPINTSETSGADNVQ